MIDLTKWHNWIAVGLMMLVVGYSLKQLSARVPQLRSITSATGVG